MQRRIRSLHPNSYWSSWRFSRVVIESKNAGGSSLARQNAKLENNQKSIEENNL
jgi:hypothetical protein